MNRRIFLASLLLPFAAHAAPLSAADSADLKRIEANLNGLKTLKAKFLQVAPNGDISGGTAWLSRPGRMRFEYDPPSPFLLVAGHGSAIFHDNQLNQTSSVPLITTPLSLLLSDDLTLSGSVTVSSIERLPGQLQVTMFRTRSPEDGSLTLVFADNPLALRQWAVKDAQRQTTTVSLFNVELGGDFPDTLFEFDDKRIRKPSGNR